MRAAVDNRIKSGLQAEYMEKSSIVIDESIAQLEEYFQGGRSSFNIPLEMVGTDFQKKVWKELLKVPFGKTVTYLRLSKDLGDENAIRAVAAANGANAMSIIVPCHRVVGSNGNLVGYAGGLAAKKKLLSIEGALLTNQLELKI